jgi:two-component system, cell cycle response regulator DivK
VLVVDDHEHTREMYAEFLAFVGFRVASAGTGEIALERARRLAPAVVVMDYSLPGLDGWEAARRLRRDARTRSTAILGITAAGDSERARALASGCDGFMEKPVAPNVLADEVGRLLRR